MSEWGEIELGLVSEIVMGQSPPGWTYNEDGVGMPLINGPVEYGKKHPTPVQWTSAPAKTCLPGDILFCVRGSTTGRINVSNDFYCIGRGVAAIRGKNGVAVTDFLEFVLRQLAVEVLEEARGSGSTFPSVTGGRLASSKVLLPPPPQQRRIATILTTLDEVIEATEKLVEKHEQIKAGLMHDLFTRGLWTRPELARGDHKGLPCEATAQEGQLRPTAEETPRLYQDSPLGLIPKAWRLESCSDLCVTVIDCKNRTPPLAEDGHAVIRTPNVRNGEFVWFDLNYTDPRSYEIWTARGGPQSGDIVITREAPVGEVCMIPDDLPAPCLGQRMMLYRPNAERINPLFMLHCLQSRRVQKFLDVISGGSTVGHVRVGDIRSLRLPCPEIGEQQTIASVVERAAENLRIQTTHLAKLRQQKQGLMHDLLTGRVRVDGGDSASKT